MKYPQLVSARAVNAISDWLVNRLEHLGVDAPLVYSRLLLSLLHTPLQINALDLAEISDLNIGNIRKNNRRFSSSDTEAIKRIAAIESLIEAVASDQKVSNVEKLVDELCEKLREIEEQNNTDESQFTDSRELEGIKRSSTPEDPTKRYYQAFPALSKDQSNEQAIFVNPKPLTWPLNSETSSKPIGSSNPAGAKRKPKRRRNTAMSKTKPSLNRKYSSGNSVWDTDFEGSWEMGRDLIREFVLMQNNRNRSISESDASTFVEIKDIIDKNSCKDSSNAKQFAETLDRTNNDIANILNDTDADQQHAMINGMEMENSLLNIAYNSLSGLDGCLSTTPRRLYEREVSNESLSMSIQEANNLASFEAKFDRNVEAIWDNCEYDDDKFIEPIRPNAVESFWFNYYKHHYNNDQQSSRTFPSTMEPNHGCHNNVGLLENVFQTQNDHRCSNEPMMSTLKTDNIWSSNAPSEDDDSFYTNATWNSSRISTENFTNTSQMNNMNAQFNDVGNVNHNDFYMPMVSKWSDCVFEIPFVPPSSSTSSTTNLSHQPDNLLITETDDKIRNDLFENSYFYQPSSVINNLKRNNDHQFNAIQFGSSNYCNDNNVTLPNHSKTSSFIAVKSSPSSSLSSSSLNISTFNCNRLSYNDPINFPRMQEIHTPNIDDDNLLTSEHTHFRPIVSYVDGHTFDIPNTLDDIKYCQSMCGELYLNSEKYKIFKSNLNKKDDFSVKFCIKQNDVHCQTDAINLDQFIFYERNYYSTYDQSDSDSLIINDQDDDLNSSFGLCEEIDTINKSEMNLDLLENWTIDSAEKKCNRNQNGHTLWEHCSVCSCDKMDIIKPANQMMIDELTADGDKIMSDLRCMYIGDDWTEDDDDDDDDENDNNNIDDDNNNNNNDDNNEHNNDDIVTIEPNNLYFNVTKLISDLLQPETVQSLAHAIGKNLINNPSSSSSSSSLSTQTSTDNINIDSEKNNNFSNNFIGGIWCNDDNNIWQKDTKSSIDNYIWSNITNCNNDNWEHSNLEQIWNSDDDDKSPETIEMKDSNQLHPIEDDYIFDLIETHELPIDNDALNRYINLNRTFNNQNNNGNDNGNDDGLMNLQNNINRCDRKRRHSASQSISEALEAMIGEGADRKLASVFNDELNVTTIITCNYWTTDTSSYINGSILKHIPMVSRPLTR